MRRQNLQLRRRTAETGPNNQSNALASARVHAVHAVMFVLQFSRHQSGHVIRVLSPVFKGLLTRLDEARAGALIPVVDPVNPANVRAFLCKQHLCIASGAPEVLPAPAWVMAGINQNRAASFRA